MSTNLIETKRRINSINSTKKITKAMKLVASVKLKKWKSLFEGNFEFAKLNESILGQVLNYVNFESIKLPDVLAQHDSDKILYVVISSDIGLCGSYNYNVFKKLDSILTSNDEIVTIGKKSFMHYRNFNNTIYSNFKEIGSTFTYKEASLIREFLLNKYNSKKYKNISIVYTKYINSLNFEAQLKRILPLDVEELKESSRNYSFKPIFEPSINEVLNNLLPHYIDSLIFQKMIEGSLCEYASRRNAMENATSNADEMIDKLQIEFNKARQAKITQEITEVTSGANATKGDEK